MYYLSKKNLSKPPVPPLSLLPPLSFHVNCCLELLRVFFFTCTPTLWSTRRRFQFHKLHFPIRWKFRELKGPFSWTRLSVEMCVPIILLEKVLSAINKAKKVQKNFHLFFKSPLASALTKRSPTPSYAGNGNNEICGALRSSSIINFNYPRLCFNIFITPVRL